VKTHFYRVKSSVILEPKFMSDHSTFCSFCRWEFHF